MFHQPDLFDVAQSDRDALARGLDLPGIVERIADVSPRPRYAFIVLNLIAKAANKANGSAGPLCLRKRSPDPVARLVVRLPGPDGQAG
jgi:hypothetical protein